MNRETLRRAVRRRFSREEAAGLFLTVGFLICATLALLFGLLADEVFEVSGASALDRGVTLWARRLPVPGGVSAVRAVTFLGDSTFVYPATLAVAGILAGRSRRVSAILFTSSVVGGGVLELLLKLAYRRPRPDLLPPLIKASSYSFPSGHATLSTVFFGGLAAVVFHLTRRRAARVAAVAGAAAVVAAVAMSRMVLGVHWLTDVAAGILIGSFWVVVSETATEWAARRSAARRSAPAP